MFAILVLVDLGLLQSLGCGPVSLIERHWQGEIEPDRVQLAQR